MADIQEVYEIVYERLLKRIHDGHPEPAPPPETPHLSSDLSWDEVSLPPSVSVTEIDRIIFSVMNQRWRKMVMVVILASRQCERSNLQVSDEIIAARIQALADEGHFESRGDLRMWRHSEIRQKR